MQPPMMMFQPAKHEVDTVPIDMHNEIVEKLAVANDELARARQKIAHLLREIEELKSR